MKYRRRREGESQADYDDWLQRFRATDNADRLKRRQKAKAQKEANKLMLLDRLQTNSHGIKGELVPDSTRGMQLFADGAERTVIAEVLLIHGIPYYLRYNPDGTPGHCTNLMQKNWRTCIYTHAETVLDAIAMMNLKEVNSGFMHRVKLLRDTALHNNKHVQSESKETV